MIWRKCEDADIAKAAQLLAQARAFMCQRGLPQWQGEYPGAQDIEKDIEQGIGWVLEEDGIKAYAALRFEKEPTYTYIEGAWHAQEPYATLHRVAVAQYGKGLAGKVFAYAATTCVDRGVHWLRIDTHQDNMPMMKAIKKFGFQECGVIYVEDGTPRMAYDKKLL